MANFLTATTLTARWQGRKAVLLHTYMNKVTTSKEPIRKQEDSASL